MNEFTNLSSIASSYTPSDYRQARFAADTGDADLPLPSPDILIDDEGEGEVAD